MFACLPDDALRRIFSHFLGWEAARAACVARAWRSWIQRDAGNWERRFFRDYHAATDVEVERQRLQVVYAGLGDAVDSASDLFEIYEDTNSLLTFSAAMTALQPFGQRFWEDETQRPHLLGSITAREIRMLRPREIWRGHHTPEFMAFDPNVTGRTHRSASARLES
jgi:hypothetical protein